MKYNDFYRLVRDAMQAKDQETFIAEIGFPDWMYDIYGDDTNKMLSDLENIYHVANMTVKDIRATTGLTQINFCARFDIPRRTLENWEAGQRECAGYIRLMIADILGLIHVARG